MIIRFLAHTAAKACDGIDCLSTLTREAIPEMLELAAIAAFLALIGVLAIVLGGDA